MSSSPTDIRWGILGTANIAAHAFLPALRAAGGKPVIVGSRSPDKAQSWAQDNEVDRTGSYQEVIAADNVDAVYVALPNELHVEWAARAAAAGKAVLCEKPLGLDEPQVRSLLTGLQETDLFWEAFVFPFHPQTDRLATMIHNGDIGDIREIISEFHFTVKAQDNIRLQPSHGGGALYDVGCYPLRLARLVSGSEPVSAIRTAQTGPTGVDLDTAAIVTFPHDVTLILSAGLRRPPSTVTRIIGASGELRLTNPFHPTHNDQVELWTDGAMKRAWRSEPGTAFQHAITHINRVIRGQEAPRHLARDDSVPQAGALDLVQHATGAPQQ